MTLYWCALLGAVFVGLAGQILLKYGAAEADFVAQLFKPATIAGMAAYGGAALLYIVALRRIPMSVALPFSAISYIGVAVIGYFVFGEAFGWTKAAAIGLICLGVALLAAA